MTDSAHSLEIATLGGGCFWCLHAVYRGIKGARNGGYCRAVVAPKVAKARKTFFEKYALLMLAALALHGCIEVHDASDDSAKIDTVSSGGAVITPAKPGTPTPMPDTYGADSATPIRGAGPTEIGLALQTDTMHALEPDSSPASTPNGVDLAILRSEMIVPVSGVRATALHDTYNERRGGGTRPHEALDILAPRGTPVLSATNGRVLKLFNSKAGGLMVYAADSTGRFILMYGHLDAYAPGLADGQPLVRGQKIGIVGTTGNAPANTPHLHFAIASSANINEWWKGMPVNPYPLLASKDREP
jgi:murein DD-endopeptidase MepM/ murein hydrolase activator NlpD